MAFKYALKELDPRILKFQAQSVCQFSNNLVSGGFRAIFKMDEWDAIISLFFDKLEVLNVGVLGIRDRFEEIHLSKEKGKCLKTLWTSNFFREKLAMKSDCMILARGF